MAAPLALTTLPPPLPGAVSPQWERIAKTALSVLQASAGARNLRPFIVPDDSMEPTYKRGDLVLIEETNCPRRGRVCLFESEGGKEALRFICGDDHGGLVLYATKTREATPYEPGTHIGYVVAKAWADRFGGGLEWDETGMGP